jgi:hypothetical protein
MSMGLGLAGVPVYVTLPVTVPAPGAAVTIAATEIPARKATHDLTICITRLPLQSELYKF